MDISDRLRAVVPPISTPLLALYYLYLPLAIFLFGWVRPEFAIPLAILSGLLPIRICRKLKSAEFHFQRRKLLIAAGIILLWVILSGIGGYVWQNRWDHFFRNAVFNDLIQRPWPVADGNDILCYYLGYWLPPALLAKITGSSAIGNFAQLIYGFFGVLLAFR
ncbi:MAG: hypothetical protein K2H35_01345, partial [Muribaculaceae bacterium]|nr:hypothetical protein [Muribaculaceae bacterium]